MAFPRLFRRLILGERGPADMVVTRTADAVHFRLPNRRSGWQAYVLILAAASLGAIVLALLFGTTFLALVLVAAYLAWRFTWHCELTLNAKHLRVDCLSSWTRRTQRMIALGHIGQFTVIRHARTALLQAESGNDETETILADRSADMLERLAHMLSERHAELAERKMPIRVAVESPLDGIRSERLLPPLNTRIVLNWHISSIMLDFPAPPLVDPEPASGQLRRAIVPCLMFGAGMSVPAAGFGVALFVKQGPDSTATILVTLVILFFPLFTALAAACVILRNEYFRTPPRRAACWLRRLVVTDDMLIRTMLNGGKQVWYRDEIERICVEVERTRIGANMLWLRLVTKAGEREDLLGAIADRGVEDYRPRAELEWIATALERALAAQPMPADFLVGTRERDWHAEQIQDRSGYRPRS
jgi:hypothetical protein